VKCSGLWADSSLENTTQIEWLHQWVKPFPLSALAALPTSHFGKEIGLKIYDRMEFAAGQNIRSCSNLSSQASLKSERPHRGDIMLLINGMLPITLHIRLKSGVAIENSVL
jgi:hypothetical protein